MILSSDKTKAKNICLNTHSCWIELFFLAINKEPFCSYYATPSFWHKRTGFLPERIFLEFQIHCFQCPGNLDWLNRSWASFLLRPPGDEKMAGINTNMNVLYILIIVTKIGECRGERVKFCCIGFLQLQVFSRLCLVGPRCKGWISIASPPHCLMWQDFNASWWS